MTSSRGLLLASARGPRRLSPTLKRINQTVGVLRDTAVAGIKMGPKVGEAIEPPEGGVRKQQMSRTVCSRSLQLLDGICAVGWVITGVGSGLGSREMPALRAIQIEKGSVSLTDHQHGCIARKNVPDLGAQPTP